VNIYTGDVCSWHVSTVRHVAIAVAIGGKPTSGLDRRNHAIDPERTFRVALGRLYD